MASARKLTKLNTRHAGLLRAGEQIVDILPANAPTQPQPSPVWLAFGAVGALIGIAIDKSKVPDRVGELVARFGPLSPIEDSKNVYQVAATDQRVLVFDRGSKNLFAQMPLAGLESTLFKHSNGMHTLVFGTPEGTLALTANRGAQEGTLREFLAAVHQSGSQQLAA